MILNQVKIKESKDSLSKKDDIMSKEEYYKEIEAKVKEWEEIIAKQKQRPDKFETYSGIPIKPLYTPLDIKDKDYLKDIGFPGQPPFTRGIYPTMYRSKYWTMRLFSGFGSPESTNQRWKFLYEHGETGFSAAVDSLTFNGIDPDDPTADLDARFRTLLLHLEVGTAGVPLYCIDSLYALCDGLPIDKISVALVVEPFSSAPVCSFYFNMVKQKGFDLKQIMGTTQNDICTLSIEIECDTGIKTIGYVPYKNINPEHLLRLACDLIEWCTAQKNVPKWHPINFTGYN